MDAKRKFMVNCTCAFICVAFVTRKGGWRDYAHKHGFKCWPIKDTRSCVLHNKKAFLAQS